MRALNHPAERMIAAIARDHGGARDQILSSVALVRTGVAAAPTTIALHIDGASLCFEITAKSHGENVIVFGRDVSAETSVREVLLESRQRYKQLIEVTADFIWECDETGAFSFISEPGAFGYPPDRVVGCQPSQFVTLDDDSEPWPNRTITPVRGQRVIVRTPSGGTSQLSLDASPIRDGQLGQRGVRGIGRSIAEGFSPAATMAAGSASSRELVSRIVQTMQGEWRPEHILQICTESLSRNLPAAGCAIYGVQENDQWLKLAEAGHLPPDAQTSVFDQMLRDRRSLHLSDNADGKVAAIVLHCQGKRTGALLLWRAADGPDWQDAEIAALGALDAQCGNAVRQALEIRRLTRLSRSDGLTGLLNQRAFLLELTAALSRAIRHGTSGALIYIDLDHFKRLNDLCGHEAGNAALTGVATILTRAIRPYDLAARLGGDEFAVWLEDISSRDANRSANRIAAAVAEWSSSHGAAKVSLGASIGLAMFDPDRAESPEDLIERADRAMYRAKRTPNRAVAVARKRRSAALPGAA